MVFPKISKSNGPNTAMKVGYMTGLGKKDRQSFWVFEFKEISLGICWDEIFVPHLLEWKTYQFFFIIVS